MNIDKHGDSELMVLADEGRTEEVIALLPSLTIDNINYKNKYNNTALYLAANHRHKEIVDLLLAAGADPAVRNKSNLCAASVAYRNGAEDICAVLPALSDEEKLQLIPPVELV